MKAQNICLLIELTNTDNVYMGRMIGMVIPNIIAGIVHTMEDRYDKMVSINEMVILS